MNLYRAWLYETSWIAAYRNRELPFNQVTFPTIGRDRNHLLYKPYLKAAVFLEVFPSTHILWKAVLGQIGLFHSSVRNVWRSDASFRAWAAARNMVLRYCIFCVITWWAVADRCHFSQPAGCEMRGSSVCCHYCLLRELRGSAGGSLCTEGVLQRGLSHCTQLWFAIC